MGSLSLEHYYRLTNPQSVALVGVSEKTGPDSFNPLENMLEDGIRRRIYPVNTRAEKIFGRQVYRSVLDLPEVVDLAVISTPRTAVPGIVRECVEKGITSVVVISQGFADADVEGARLQEEIQRIIAGTGTRLIGPNTIGIINVFDSFHSSFVKFDVSRKDNGIICQSGIFVLGATDFTEGMGLGVDIGNAADVNFADVLDCFGQDPRIKAVNIHMEGIRGGREFLTTACRVTREKPVLVLKTGKSAVGARAAASHSGSLAGEDHVFTAAFKKAGVIRVEDLEELKDLNKAFLTYPEMNGKRVGVITITGGGGIVTVDALSRYGLEVARLSPDPLAKIQAMCPPWFEAANPLDIWPAGMKRGLPNTYADILRLMLDDPAVDAVICIFAAYKVEGHDPVRAVLAGVVQEAARNRQKPVAVWVFGASQQRALAELDESGVVAGFPNPERAARALAGLYRYHREIKGRQWEKPPAFPEAGRARAAALLSKARAAAGTGLIGSETLEILEAYGIPTAPVRFAAGEKDARAAARELGYPLVVKITGPEVVHKSDLGGVRLNIRDEAELIRACAELPAAARAKEPGVLIAGFHLQKYYPGGREVILGAKQDAEFGPVIVFGLGGIYTEVLKDVSFRLAPLTEKEAREMLAEIKSFPLLTGARGGPPADLDALVDCLLRLGRLVIDFPQLAELDINPLAVWPRGALALDARAAVKS